MTDRELLEMAAKAVGINARWFNVKQWNTKETPAGKCRFLTGEKNVFGTHHSKPWNPLESDADAFRLMVGLGMRVYVYNGLGDDYSVAASGEPGSHVTIRENHDNDPKSATRRAIVLAAAEIGRWK